MARLKQKIIPGGMGLHIRNSGFKVFEDLHDWEKRNNVPIRIIEGVYKRTWVPDQRVIWIDTAKNKYDKRGKRKPATLPESRRFKEAA